jgi:hypothetical protein
MSQKELAMCKAAYQTAKKDASASKAELSAFKADHDTTTHKMPKALKALKALKAPRTDHKKRKVAEIELTSEHCEPLEPRRSSRVAAKKMPRDV